MSRLHPFTTGKPCIIALNVWALGQIRREMLLFRTVRDGFSAQIFLLLVERERLVGVPAACDGLCAAVAAALGGLGDPVELLGDPRVDAGLVVAGAALAAADHSEEDGLAPLGHGE